MAPTAGPGKPNKEQQQYDLNFLLDSEVQIRFWLKVDRRGPDECWLWNGSRDTKGYGRILVRKLVFRAHRAVCFWTHGAPTTKDKSFYCHSCDNPPCCNPRHLRWGTKADNASERNQKRRHWLAKDPKGQSGSKNPNAKLSLEEVQAIRVATGPQRLIAKKFGCAQTQVSRIKLGQRRADG